MPEYRTGAHWGRTIIKVGALQPDGQGRRKDDELVGVIDDPVLAERICTLLNDDELARTLTVLRPSIHPID